MGFAIELSDEDWGRIADLFDPPGRRGAPARILAARSRSHRMTDVLVISGPAGVGKSSAGFEVSLRLQAEGTAHALIDTDELDHIYPIPADLPRTTERNLCAM